MTSEKRNDSAASNPAARTAAKKLVFALGFLVTALGTLAAVFSLASSLPRQPWQAPIGVIDKILPRLEALEGSAGTPGLKRIAVLGDSTVVEYAPGKTIPDRLQQALAGSAPPGQSVEVANLAFLGLGPTAYYFLADRIAATRPDLIVWQTSLTHASERWRRSLPRPQLAGWMAPRRIPEAIGMPIEDIGLTADELLFYQLIVQSGLGSEWLQWQINLSRVDKARRKFEEWLSTYTETEPEKRFSVFSSLRHLATLRHPDKPKRYNRLGEREHFGSVLDGIDTTHPTLRFIAASISIFAHAGIPVLVYLNPVNIEHLNAIDIIEESKFRQTLDSYRHSAHGPGVAFIDLHDFLPDGGFADMSGHFRHDDEVEIQTDLANFLARRIREDGFLEAEAARPGRQD